jgi:TolQ protein
MMSEPHSLSFVALFLEADIVVKGVMLLLAFFSLACWTLVVEKITRLFAVRRQVRAFEQTLAANAQIRNLQGDLSESVVAAGLDAWHDGDASESRAERRERIERAMRGAMMDVLRRLEHGLPFLATIGSAAPFIGLFGTVWGIMNSFSAIAASQDTSLAVVAPGIAEALFATAIGLVAAIPAVMAYNKFTTDLGRIAHRTNACIAILGNRLARDHAGKARIAAAE